MNKKRNTKIISLALMGCLILGVAVIAVPAMANTSQTNGANGLISRGLGTLGIHCGLNNLDKQLENGSITQEQYDGMQAVQEKVNSLREEMQESWTKGLLDNKIITQEQYEEILKNQTERTKLMQSLKGLTPEERQAKMAEFKKTKLQELLDNGEITQEQYDKMIENQGNQFGGKHQARNEKSALRCRW